MGGSNLFHPQNLRMNNFIGTGRDVVSWAHPAAGELLTVEFPHRAGRFFCSKQASMVAYAGHVYLADQDGTIVRFVTESSVQRCHAELIIAKAPNAAATSSSEDTTGRRYGREFLVASAEDLLLVCHLRRRRRRTVEVFRVDVERKALDPVKSIGRRALFLSRCLSLDHADRLHSVRSNCVYRVAGNGDGVWEYDLGDGGREKMISTCPSARPFAMVQVLMNYCVALPDVKSQLHTIYQSSTSD